MHIVLTDILTCPRCGPGFGLILLADRIMERRVDAGVLGCSNCREQYPIRDGAVDFVGAAGSGGEEAEDRAADPRLAPLLGVTHGPAFVLLAGPARTQAGALAAMLEDVEVVTVASERTPARPGVNPLITGPQRLPVADMKVAGVALTGAAADALLEEGARVVSAVGRLVLDPAPHDAAERLARLGLRIAAQQDGVAVAVRC
ncbi:MAG TPA: Trm112 family protein [Longimicrobiales bacterium]